MMARAAPPYFVVIQALLAGGVAIAQIPASDRGSPLAQAGQNPVGAAQGVVLTDEPRPRPIGNARVVVFRAFAELPDVVWTNDVGRFSFPVGTTASTTIRVSRSGFIAQFAQGLRAGSDVEVRLMRAGVVTGHVTNERGDRVWGSTVELRAEDPAQRAAQTAAPLTTRTDDRGEFRFSSIKPGPYVVIVHPAAPWSVFGRTELVSMPPETPVDVVAGREATVSLAYGATETNAATGAPFDNTPRAPIRLSGRLLDQGGRALNGANVRLFPEGLGSVSVSDSDAQGRYDLRLSAAGTYRLFVTLPGGGSFEYGQRRAQEKGRTITLSEKQTTTLDIVIPTGGTISGRITDASGEPVEGLMVHPWEAQWADGRVVVRPLRIVSTTDDRGRYRVSGLPPGTYYLGISDEVSNSHGPVNVVSARVFYPGGTSIATASPLEVDTGTESSGVDVVLDPSIGTRVVGSVRLSTDEPPNAGQVRFFADSRLSSGPVREALIDALGVDGSFLFQDVPPGDYVVHVIAGRSEESLNEVGVATVSVGGRETSSDVRTVPASALSGNVVFEGAPPPPLPAVTVSTLSADVNTSPMSPSSLQKVELRSDWTFEVGNLFGPTRIVATAPAGWWLKSVMLDGRNLADEPMTFGTGDRTHTGAEILFVRNRTALTGTARERDRPIMDYSVVVYPTDVTLQYPRSRHMALVQSGQDGRYTASNLPPGTYWVAAVDGITGDVSGGDWQSPELIALVTRSARRVTIEANRSISVDLVLIRLPRQTLH
jgi:hypothetical protein